MLMREAVQRWHEAQEHDAWFRGEVEQALGEAAGPAAERVPHDQVNLQLASTARRARAAGRGSEPLRIEWLPASERDQRSRLEWVLQRDACAAIDMRDAITGAVERLADRPAMARARRVHGTRELVVVGPPTSSSVASKTLRW